MAWPAGAGAASLAVIGGTDSRTVPLQLTKSGTTSTFAGNLHVALQNTGNKTLTLRILYVRDAANRPDVLPGHSTVATLFSPAGKPTVKAGRVTQLNIRFSLPADAPPDSLKGTLAIQAGSQNQVSLPLTGAVKPLGDVRFEPTSAVVQVTRGCVVFDCNTTGGGSVTLRGTGVGQLLLGLKTAGQTELTTELRRDGTEPVEAKLTNLQAVPGAPGTATASLELGSKPAAGKYAGSLPVAPLEASSASLPVEVHSRVWVLWAVLLIFAGVLSAGYVTKQIGLTRRKRLVKDALERSVGQYCARHGENFPNGPNGNSLVWDLKVDCPLRENPNWSYYDDLDSPSNIYSAARWGRSDADLDEAQTATVTFIGGLKEWLLALTQCRALYELSCGNRLKPERWAKTNVARDTDLLLRRARHVPVDGAAGSQLLAAVELQTSWHRRFAETWDLRSRLVRAGGDAGDAASDVDIDALDKAAPPAASRTQDQQDDLDRKLEADNATLLELRDQSNEDTSTPDVPLVAIGPGEQELQAAALRTELDSLQSFSAQPQMALANLSVSPTVAGSSGPAVATASPGGDGPSIISPARLLRRLMFIDFFLSLAILLVTSLLYAATVYDDTWGTPADLASAFGAGFLGQLTIKWGVLPIYRSLRLRATPVPGSDSAADAPAAVAAS